MARIKGFGLRGALKYAKTQGIDPRDLVAGLPGEIRAAFSQTIHQSEWYPYEAFAALLRELDRRLASPGRDVMRDMGNAAARQDVSGMFRIVTYISSPESAGARAGIFWERYYDKGKLMADEARPGYLRTRIEGFPEIDPLHCRVLAGWIEGLGMVWGARNIAVRHTECVHRGDAHCVYEATWE